MKPLALRVGRLALAGVASALLALQARATWSIVVVDRATGEVCVAGATCIENSFLKNAIGIVVVGKGGGAGQAFANPGRNAYIGQHLALGWSPAEILQGLGMTDGSHAYRQYGIVNFDDPSVTFSGNQTGQARPGVAGESGSLRYAIQGNVLAGDIVVYAAEQTLLTAPGDLGQRVMAAMETARSYGGDGRCSCDGGAPTSCGAPPPNFTKSAHTAFIVVARIGDRDGTCIAVGGCANGDYYLDRRYVGDASDIDPIFGLQMRYDAWRASRIGIVDQILSEVVPSAERLVADGVSTVDVRLRLRDLDGTALTAGGQTVHVRGIGGPQTALIEGVVDHQDGTHTITLRAGTTPGQARWRIVVDDGEPRYLHPPLELDVDPLVALHSGFDVVSASRGADVPLTTHAGPSEAGRAYLVLASAAGTSPGTPFSGQVLPLNSDRLLRFTLARPGPPLFPDSAGQLDATGRAQAVMHLTPEVLGAFVGGRFDFVTVLLGTPDAFTNTAGFDILP